MPKSSASARGHKSQRVHTGLVVLVLISAIGIYFLGTSTHQEHPQGQDEPETIHAGIPDEAPEPVDLVQVDTVDLAGKPKGTLEHSDSQKDQAWAEQPVAGTVAAAAAIESAAATTKAAAAAAAEKGEKIETETAAAAAVQAEAQAQEAKVAEEMAEKEQKKTHALQEKQKAQLELERRLKSIPSYLLLIMEACDIKSLHDSRLRVLLLGIDLSIGFLGMGFLFLLLRSCLAESEPFKWPQNPEEVKDMFEKIDKNHDEKLTHREIKTYIQAHEELRYPMQISSWNGFWSKIDTDDNESIDYEEFETYILPSKARSEVA